jgi:tRNA G10  N-methylase Trm11
MQHLFLTGIQRAWSERETRSVVPITAVHKNFLLTAAINPLPPGLINRLGGTSRIAEVLGVKDGKWTPEEIIGLLTPLPEKKFKLGLSIIEEQEKLRLGEVKRLAIALKQGVKAAGGRLAFIIPTTRSLRLNAAQVLFNQLTAGDNAEILLAQAGDKWYLARTVQSQNIQAYEQRDTAKPGRDPKVGMLPPKIAQMMINIVTEEVEGPVKILDPFCGTGTILQEGWLLGHHMLGSDASPSMVELARTNLDWLATHFSVKKELWPELLIQDTRQAWPSRLQQTITTVATEPYLGAPLDTPLPAAEIKQRFQELGELYQRSLFQLKEVLKPGGKVLFLLPAFRNQQEEWQLLPEARLDEIMKLGYRLVELKSAREEWIYGRPRALVGRELTLWIKV